MFVINANPDRSGNEYVSSITYGYDSGSFLRFWGHTKQETYCNMNFYVETPVRADGHRLGAVGGCGTRTNGGFSFSQCLCKTSTGRQLLSSGRECYLSSKIWKCCEKIGDCLIIPLSMRYTTSQYFAHCICKDCTGICYQFGHINTDGTKTVWNSGFKNFGTGMVGGQNLNCYVDATINLQGLSRNMPVGARLYFQIQSELCSCYLCNCASYGPHFEVSNSASSNNSYSFSTSDSARLKPIQISIDS